MKSISMLFLVICVLLSLSAAQSAPARTDVYHVHFTKAALGKAAQLGDYLKTPDPNAAMPEHRIVLRHQDGEDWDYVVIQHLGTKATVDAAGNPPPAAARDLSAWHGDTFVAGPAWPEFTRALGLGDQVGKTAGSVYVVAVQRAAPGHRDQLEKILSEPPGAGDPVAGVVLMVHLEGGPWQYLTITRYNSWQDFASSETNSVAKTNKGTGGWFEFRDHVAYHNDTLTDRIAP